MDWDSFSKVHPGVSKDEFNNIKIIGVKRRERAKADKLKFRDLFFDQFPLADKSSYELVERNFLCSCLTPRKYMRSLLGKMSKFIELAPQYYIVKFDVSKNRVFMNMRVFYRTSEYEGYSFTDGKLLLSVEDIKNSKDRYSYTREGAIAKAKKQLHKYVPDKNLRKKYVKQLNMF
jgi:hypothetical protein